MRARLRSYGETSTRTRSPGRMRMRKRRILPATWPRTSWPLSSCTRNIAFGSASTTSPSNSTFSSFAKTYMTLTFDACGPFAPSPSSYSTFAPSARVRKPSPEIPEKCTNASFPPSSGVMNPNPFSSLNHFTTPVANTNTSSLMDLMRKVVLPGTAFPHASSPLSAARTGRIYTSRGDQRSTGSARGLRAAGVSVAGGRLRGRLVLLGIEALVGAARLGLLGPAGVLRCLRRRRGRRRRGRRRRRRRRRRQRRRGRHRGVLDGAAGRVALAAAAGVAAEEGLCLERMLGRREVPAELALGLAHVRVPDLGRERAAGDVRAVVEAEHLRAVVGIADPDGGRQARREADEPGVGELVGGARLTGGGAADLRLGARAALDVLLEDLGRLGGRAVREGAGAPDLPARGQLLVPVGED